MWNSAWPTLAMTSMEQSLNAVENTVRNRNPSASDDENNYLARFLVVRTCGLIEQTVEQCCRSYLVSKSDQRSSSFGESWFGKGANPKPDSLIKLVGRFDSNWAIELEELLRDDDEYLWRELSFLVDRRNKIAHGLNEGIGVRKALDLVDVSKIICDWFVQTFDPR